MANNIPVFEFGKDSYILKHKLNYNMSYENEWSGITNGILFTDYDIARKSNSINAENFDPIIINDNINDISAFKLKYYDQEYTIELSIHQTFSELVCSGTSLWDGTSGTTGATFMNSGLTQVYYADSGYTSLFSVNDYFNIYFQEISGLTGTTVWEHTGPAGETWITTGITSNGVPWQVTGTTTINGYSTGVTTYTVTDYTPYLKYRAQVIEVGINYLKFERKLEDNIFNDLMKIASNNNFNYLHYTLESLDFSDPSYFGIKYILEETVWSDYFSISASTNQLIIEPIPNKKDLYFDYDNIEFIVYNTGGTNYYSFETNALYTKYKLDIFLDQLGFPSDTSIYYDHVSTANSNPYNGELEFDIELTTSGDSSYFTPYTYIYATGNTSVVHICLIRAISGNTLTVVSPKVNMINSEYIVSVNNMYTSYDISRMLYECYINIEAS